MTARSDYDVLIVTHLPAFYKVNLYHELAKTCRVFVIFIAACSDIRTADFTQNTFHFDYAILNQTSFEKRNRLWSVVKLIKTLKQITYQKLIVGGWDLIEFWALVLSHAPHRCMLALESSKYDSAQKGIAAVLKKIFISRIDTILASGEPHQDLLKALGYQGRIKKTLGVGIFRYTKRVEKNIYPKQVSSRGKFLYVGRLAPEKNLFLLLAVFKKHPEFELTLVGQGPLERALKIFAAGSSIHFAGHVSNAALSSYYETHDVFILPSLREPWGLVVEEALYHGLPVIASKTVGCAPDLIERQGVGVVFDPMEEASLEKAINVVIEQYATLTTKVKALDFKVRDTYQVSQYVEALYPKQMDSRGGAEFSRHRNGYLIHEDGEMNEGNNAEDSSGKGIP